MEAGQKGQAVNTQHSDYQERALGTGHKREHLLEEKIDTFDYSKFKTCMPSFLHGKCPIERR